MTFANFTLSTIILFLTLLFFSTYSSSSDLSDKIKSLEEELAMEREYKEIYELTKDFIRKSSVGDHGDLLTGEAKESYDRAIQETKGSWNNNYHAPNLIADLKIYNAYGMKTDDDRGLSYAIYRVSYSNNPNSDSFTSQTHLTLSFIGKWEITKDGFKIYEYEIDVLEDSLDKYLRELAKEEIENKLDYESIEEDEGDL